jgi:hypothetical protein
MCDVLPRGRRVRQGLPRHPQCLESDTPATIRGPGPAGVNHSNVPRQAERQRRWDRSLQNAGINEAIQQFHGILLHEARSLSAHITYEQFTHLESDPGFVRQIFDSVRQNLANRIRDQGLSRMLPQFFSKFLGSPLTYISGLQNVYDQSQWEHRNTSRRTEFRTQQVYARLLWVVASTAAEGNLQLAIAYNITLVEQGLRYVRWRENELPLFRQWERQNFITTERGQSYTQGH